MSERTAEQKQFVRCKLVVMQAWLNGSNVEYRQLGLDTEDMTEWRAISQPNWNWIECQYRIVPVPAEWWYAEYHCNDTGELWRGFSYKSPEDAAASVASQANSTHTRIVHMKEVVEDDE